MQITEIFHSIQGEGTLMGLPMLFVRTNTCNLRCTWCDTKYSFYNGREIDLEDLAETVQKSDEKWVCFTGGEPLVQREALEFVKMCLDSDKNVLIETNGTIPIEKYVFSDRVVIDMDVKPPSAEVKKPFFYRNLEYLRDRDYIKIVIASDEDLAFAMEFINGLDKRINVVIQPAWGNNIRKIA
ncbi:MAG: 7-carboxy-7-deazaguanine synthase QueE, partial [Thermoplasmata archaeon]